MIDWVVVREAVRQALASAAGIVPESVAWQGHSEAGAWQAFPYIEVRTLSRKAWDDSVIYSAGPSGELVKEVQGPRTIRVQLKIVSNNQDDLQAADIAERLQTQLGFDAYQETLANAECALGAWGDTLVMDFDANGRQNSCAVVEVSLNLSQNVTDTTASPDYIETVTYQADTIKLPSGADSPLQPTVTVTKP